MTADSGIDAIHILKSKRVDIVLTDQRMPGMSGVELCKYIKDKYPNVPCLIITGYPDQSVIDRAIGQGHIRKYITKPWDPTSLREEIEASIL